jgi:hypothetical protein
VEKDEDGATNWNWRSRQGEDGEEEIEMSRRRMVGYRFGAYWQK